ncbi:guanine nucleotide-binding protein G(I)/G(S)/G(O) subunit gamma-12-like [Crassostrea virginica]
MFYFQNFYYQRVERRLQVLPPGQLFEEVVDLREIQVVVFTMPFQTKSDQIAKLRGTADQMRHHLKVDRMVMSKTIAEIVNYCNHMAAEDPLIFPVKDNPFKDKKSCAIL